MDKLIYLIGTLFEHSGSGVPDTNITYYNYIKRTINVEKIDILEIAKKTYNLNNEILLRNLALLKIGKQLKGKNIHVLHTSDLCLTFPVIDMSKNANRKIITVHDLYPFIKSPYYGPMQKFTYKLKQKDFKCIKDYDHVFVRSTELATKLENSFEVDPKNMTVQGPIIDYKFKPLNDAKNSSKKIIGYINDFGWGKAPMFKYFLETFKKLQDDQLEFHIYGKNFPFAEMIKSDSRIKYFGFLDENEMVPTLGTFSAYLSTSILEGFGIPIAKAKAMKIPVLCYDGELPAIMKRNTDVWNQENLEQVLQDRTWEKVDIEKAYNDIEDLRPDKIISSTLKVYEKIFI